MLAQFVLYPEKLAIWSAFFLDLAPLHANPQIEYDYWKNKYGIESISNFDTDQNTASLLVNVHF